MRGVIDTSLLDALQRPGGATPGLGEAMPGTMPAQPFTWGQGGTRVSPEQLDLQRQMAAGMLQEGTSSAPVGHWLQGANRVAQALLGGAEMRDIRQQDQSAQSDVAAQLAKAFGPGNEDLVGLQMNPATAGIVDNLFAQRNPKAPAPTEVERLGQLAGWTPQQVADAAGKILTNRGDPVISGVMGGQSYAGPQSWVLEQFGGGGGQVSGGVGAGAPSRPQGASDEQLLSEARSAISKGADPTAVFKQLKGWGVGL